MAFLPTAFADEGDAPDPGSPIQEAAAPESDNAQPAAVTACGAFAQALDSAQQYYGDFADSFEGSDYADPAVQSSNEVGRAGLRQAAQVATDAANTPDLDPSIGDPMRAWSGDATRLLVKMAVHIPGTSLDTSVAEMNTDATNAQHACAAAGTHA
jgi:hypothetical protein